MKAFLAFLFLAFCALCSVSAAPSWGLFVSDYETDVKNLGRGRTGGNLIDRLRGDERFSKFVDVLSKERGLRDDLENSEKESTVFAPTNEAMDRFEEEMNRGRRDRGHRNERDEEEMREILRYHICPDTNIEGDQLHAGTLLPTGLRLKSLGDRHQRVRVFRFHGDAWLNMHSRIVKKDIEADNGRIHAIDRVLVPPTTADEMLYTVPTEFSTFIAAMERTGMADKVHSEKAITVFAPNNRAWMNLGYDNLRYLFSCVGQKTESGRDSYDREGRRRESCKGVKELEKIIEYHIATELAWSTDIMDKKEMRLETLGDEELNIKASQKGERNERDEKRKGGKDVRKYNFVLNQGEARVQFTDGLARNGAIQAIDNVLIPQNVRLPHDKM